MKFDLLFGLAAVLFVWPHTEATLHYFGCFHDLNNAHDLDTQEMAFEHDSLTVMACTQQCRDIGAPYAGIRQASTCFCGMSYGRYGHADNINCNFTCQGQTNLQYCGGISANSVYYALDTDPSHDADRELYAHGDTPANFEAAREICVSTDGDLATMVEFVAMVNTTSAMFNLYDLEPAYRKYWIGLNWHYIPQCGSQICSTDDPPDADSCTYFDWVNPSFDAFICSAYTEAFQTGESFQNRCIVVDIDTGRLETTSCLAQYPYLCFSKREADEGNVEEEFEEVQAANNDDTKERIALYVVMPLFIFCYGGSCVLYCIHKLRKMCLRRNKEKMLLEHQEGDFTEFEPDTKPKHGSEKQPVPWNMNTIDWQGSNLTGTSRPSTADGVQINFSGSPPSYNDVDGAPAYYKKTTLKKVQKMRMEQRRSRLLENALKEARERRGAQETPQATELNEIKSPVPDVREKTMSRATPKKSSRGDRSNRYRTSPTGEFSPSSSLIGGDEGRNTESPDDPTTMSIADIMRVKKMMKEKKKRVRKILSC